MAVLHAILRGRLAFGWIFKDGFDAELEIAHGEDAELDGNGMLALGQVGQGALVPAVGPLGPLGPGPGG